MYHPPETVYSDCGEGQKMADTCKGFQPFPAPHIAPRKTHVKLGRAHMRITAEELQIRTDYILFHRGSPRSFSMLSMTFLKTS